MKHPPQNDSRRKTTLLLLLSTCLMFGFGFALVPMYNVLCDITGLNGRVPLVAAEESAAYDIISDRDVVMELAATLNQGMPWEFGPDEDQIEIQIGELAEVSYYAHNKTGRDLVIQAIPSISPGMAAKHLHKIECFCFDRQEFSAGETRHMPVRFYLDEGLPRHIDRVTLSYTLFEIK